MVNTTLIYDIVLLVPGLKVLYVEKKSLTPNSSKLILNPKADVFSIYFFLLTGPLNITHLC